MPGLGRRVDGCAAGPSAPRQARGPWTESVGSVNFCGRCISVLV